MAITAPPDIPLITDPSTFSQRAQDWVVWQADDFYPALVDFADILTESTNSTSVTSNTIGPGSKTFTVQTGLGYVVGMSLSIAYTTLPTRRMFAVVTSYNSGTGALIVNVQAVEGSGTYTAWSIALAYNGIVSNAQLADGYINDLTIVTLDPAADYLAIADGSEAGNKKKALIPNATETAVGLVELATNAEAQAFTANKFIDGAKLTAALKGANQSLSANGYQKLPGGLIVQWGQSNVTAGTLLTVSLPIAFPNAFLALTSSVNAGNATAANYGNAQVATLSQLRLSVNTGAGVGVYWFAIGN